MKQLIKRLWEPKKLLFIAILYTTFISIALLSPMRNTVAVMDIPYADKIVHIVINCGLYLLWSFYVLAHKTAQKKYLVLLFIGAFFYGILIEVIQELYIPTRGADVFDVVANFIGLNLGLFIITKTKKINS